METPGQRVALDLLPAGRRHDDRAPMTPGISVAYSMLGVLLAAYVVMVLVYPNGQESSLLNNWVVDGFEVVVALLCIARAIRGGPLRPVAIALGTGLLAWALGDVVWDIETRGELPTPRLLQLQMASTSVFYPLAFVALMISLMRKEVKKLPLAIVWLDGIVVGLGAAALTAAFAFDTISRALGGRSHLSLLRSTFSPTPSVTCCCSPWSPELSGCSRRGGTEGG